MIIKIKKANGELYDGSMRWCDECLVREEPWFSDREKDLDFCSEECYSEWNETNHCDHIIKAKRLVSQVYCQVYHYQTNYKPLADKLGEAIVEIKACDCFSTEKEEKESLQNEVNDLNSQINRLESDLQNSKRTVNEFISALQNFYVSNGIKEVDNFSSMSLVEKINCLKREFERVVRERDSSNSSLNTAKAKIDSLNSQMNLLKKENTSLNTNLIDTKSKLDIANGENKDFREELFAADARSKLWTNAFPGRTAQEASEEILNLKNDVEQQEKNLENIEITSEQLKKVLSDLSQVEGRFNQEKQRLETELANEKIALQETKSKLYLAEEELGIRQNLQEGYSVDDVLNELKESIANLKLELDEKKQQEKQWKEQIVAAPKN